MKMNMRIAAILLLGYCAGMSTPAFAQKKDKLKKGPNISLNISAKKDSVKTTYLNIGLLTNFGKFMDPLADKLLVCSAMICLVDLKLIPVWVVLIIIAREFIISGFRLVASDNGIVIAASYWGKFKTTFQMLMVIVIIFNINLQLGWLNILGTILIYVALVLTVVSLIDYIAKNKDVLKDQK